MEQKKCIAFRADGGESIGMGHIMRCIGLAQEFNKRGYRPFFVSALHSDKVADRLAYEGFDYVCSDSEIASSADLEFLVRKCQEHACNSVVVDGYGFGSDWLGELHNAGFSSLLWTDYVQAERLPVDIVLDQTPVNNETKYKNAALETTKVLNGLKYVVLRDEFLNRPDIRRLRTGVNRLLITFGGSDSTGGTVKALEALQGFSKELQIDVVIGPANPLADRILELVSGSESIKAHVATNNMAELIANADLAISAAGTSLWEFAYSGLPTIAISIADNQLPLAKSLERYSCSVYLGPLSGFSSHVLRKALDELLDDERLIANYSAKMLELVDGDGRVRVVDTFTVMDAVGQA